MSKRKETWPAKPGRPPDFRFVVHRPFSWAKEPFPVNVWVVKHNNFLVAKEDQKKVQKVCIWNGDAWLRNRGMKTWRKENSGNYDRFVEAYIGFLAEQAMLETKLGS